MHVFQEVDEDDQDAEVLDTVKDMIIIKQSEKYRIILENSFLESQMDNLAQAVQLLFAYIWVLNLQYPKGNKFFWEFLEKCVVKIGQGNTSAKIILFQRKLAQV